jgi:hypothetical protein
MIRSALVAVAFALAACGSSGPATHFAATLNSASETPTPPNPNASATGTASYTVNGTTVDYSVPYSGLSGNISAAHIHVGAAGVAGTVVVPLTLPSPRTASGTLTGSFTATNVAAGTSGSTTIAAGDLDSLLAAMRAGNTYTNLHTGSNPNGEIRGQNNPQ